MTSSTHIRPVRRALVILIGIAVCIVTTRVHASELTEIQKLVASTGVGGDDFGSSCAIDGDVAVVGAPFARANEGAAWVYRRAVSGWVEEQVITVSDGGVDGLFGTSVSVGGDVVLIGGRGFDGFTGAAYVFRYDGSTWVEEQKLVPAGALPGDELGFSVSLSGNVALVGASDDDGGAGSAFVFRYDGSTWVEEKKLVGADTTSGDEFGRTVSLDGDVALIGARSDDDAGDSSGSAYVFRFDGLDWSEEQKLTASDAAPGALFGFTVELEGASALVGASRSGSSGVYAFRFDGASWVEEALLESSDREPFDSFGLFISLDGGTALIGASGNEGAGAAYVFRRTSAGWFEAQRFRAADSEAGDSFASCVGLCGEFAVLGARGDDLGRGSAYVFARPLCLTGTTNAGNGFLIDSLFVDGSTGGNDRTVDTTDDRLIALTLVKPFTGGTGRFVLHGDAGAPVAGESVALPASVGTTCFPFLLSGGASPLIIANNLGRTSRVGTSQFFGVPAEDPERATTTLEYPPLPAGTELTFQAILLDLGSASPKGASVTNGIVIRVLP